MLKLLLLFLFVTSAWSFNIPSEDSDEVDDDKPLEVKFTAHGLMPAAFTPMNEDQTVNVDVIPAYAKHLAENGIKAVLVGGTNGEHMALSVENRKKVIDAWVRTKNATGLHIQVQVGGAPLQDVLHLAKYADTAGVDSILTLPELYFKPTTIDELVSYVQMVSNAAPHLPILYYHIPDHTEVNLNMPEFVAAATASIPNFRGLKFTSSDLNEAAQIVNVLKDGQEIFIGKEAYLAPAALLGIKSVIGGGLNVFPKMAQQVLEAIKEGDMEKVQVYQKKLTDAVESVKAQGGRRALKASFEIATGIKMGPPVLPNKPISAEAKEKIAEGLRNLEIL